MAVLIGQRQNDRKKDGWRSSYLSVVSENHVNGQEDVSAPLKANPNTIPVTLIMNFQYYLIFLCICILNSSLSHLCLHSTHFNLISSRPFDRYRCRKVIKLLSVPTSVRIYIYSVLEASCCNILHPVLLCHRGRRQLKKAVCSYLLPSNLDHLSPRATADTAYNRLFSNWGPRYDITGAET